MEKLKLVLKKALAQGASHAILRLGEQGKVVVQHGREVPLPEFGVVDQPWIDGLFKALFPREGLALLSQQCVRSQFNIVNVGKVNVIADPRPPKTLHLFFPPSGERISEDFWISLSGPAKVEAPPPPPAYNPPAPQEPIRIPDPAGDAATQLFDTQKGATVQAGAATISQALKPDGTKAEASKPAQGTQVWQVIEATALTHASIPIPEEVTKNRLRLALILSGEAPAVEAARKTAESMNLYAHAFENDALFHIILDRFTPQIIFLDEKTAKFQGFLKKIYDMEMMKRSSMTVMLFSRIYQMGDTKAAFACSVDGIMNRESLANLTEYTVKVDAERKAVFQAWWDLTKKS